MTTASPTPSTPSAAVGTPPASPAPIDNNNNNNTPAGDPAAPPAAPPVTSPAGDPAHKDDDTPKPLSWAERRTAYAKGDDKMVQRLARYASEEAVIDALLAAQNKISSGGLKSKLPDNPTTEQLNEWRAENGIPDRPEDYSISLPEGTELSPDGEVLIADLAKMAHEANMTPAHLEKTLGFLMQRQAKEQEAAEVRDEQYRQEAEDVLRREWGGDFKLNNNLINGLLEQAPQGVKEQLIEARLPDGSVLGNNPQVLRWLATMARELNPTPTIVPAAGMSALQTVDAELATIQGLMGDHESAYWKGPQAKTMQARFLELTTAKQKYGKR